MTEPGGFPSAILVVGTAASSALLLVALVRRYALRHQILDQPGPRGSHTRPTPRGGGLGLVIAVLVTVSAFMGRRLDSSILFALAGVILTAAVGWLDDRHSLGVRTRLAAHIAAGASLLPLALWPTVVPPWFGVFAGLWWIFWAVSSINLVNFMDGIDGLIASQALVFGGYVVMLAGVGGLSGVVGLSLAGAAAGFLVWNWPPARIFLGDVGSGALGLLFVLAGILLLRDGQVSLVVAYLPLYAIFLDATVTLFRRFRRGERVTEAHRDHLYQRLANGGWGHARVTLLYAAVAVAAFPIAGLPGGVRTTTIGVYFGAVLCIGFALDRHAALSRG